MTTMKKPMRVLFLHRASRVAVRFALAAGVTAFGGCKSLLDVDNPNNVSSSALDVPAAAPAIVSGAENLTGRALSSLLNFYTPASDEAYWVGSRDDYRLLDSGEFGINTNEYVQSAYLNIAQARWMGDQAVLKVAKFNADGQLLDKQLLARAYLNAAIMYTNIAGAFDDFAISDRTVAGKNYGEAGMSALYDSALKWLDLGSAIASERLKTATLGMRARVKFEKALWQKLNPAGTTPASPLVNDAGATADATAALALMTGDFRWDLITNDLNEGDGSGGGFGFEMNSRVEYTCTKDLCDIDPNNGKPKSVIAKDPVTNLVDSAAVKIIGRITAAINHPPITQVSEREMRLIIAEAALAANNNAGFDTAINLLRAMDGRAAYTGAGPTRLALLQWERRINLIFQARRINDMYRFGVKDPKWVATGLAITKPGCLFPIPLIERESNTLVTGTPVCK
jgi:starch-binding outer membrane protein, SusD/RagB family